ncbi:CSEP0437 putative effector protein [Blumeria hordei DH14]|uniref:CSEP0437 putative effector protein n=1 Tax=Blumeria graminis f. sp. hordei (strain DH14) TaxID=546991 RepID=N1JG34_BLUG1|nr:CSEP0437 putative effector protein [Blumeria hordei DH14]
MRSYINIICLAIVAAIIFAAPNNTLSLHRPAFSAMDKRNIGKDHTGYQCGSTKHKLNKILDAIQMACPDPAQSDSFWFSYNDSGFPKTFSEAQRLGLPTDTMITPVRGGFFESSLETSDKLNAFLNHRIPIVHRSSFIITDTIVFLRPIAVPLCRV